MSTRLVAYIQSMSARDESGASIVEYAILVALIAVALIGVITALTGRIGETFNDVEIPT